MNKVKIKEFLSTNKELMIFGSLGFICVIYYMCIFFNLSYAKIPDFRLLGVFKHFYVLEIFLVAIVSLFYSFFTQEKPDCKKNLLLSFYYLCGYVLGELALIIIAIITIIGAIWLIFYVATYNIDILKSFIITSVIRVFYIFGCVFIVNNFVFGLKKIISSIKEQKLNAKTLLTPLLFLFISPIIFIGYNFLTIHLNRILTEPEFYIGSDARRKNPQIVFDNGDTLWYIPAYVSRDVRFSQQEAESVEFYDYSSKKTYLIKKPFKTTNKAIILPNHQVLFIGGKIYSQGKNTIDKSSYIFDTNKKEFKKVGDLKLIQEAPNPIILPTGNVVFMDDQDRKNFKAQVYDNKSCKFSVEKILFPIWNGKGLNLNNGKVLIYGSYLEGKNNYLIKTQLYDLKANKFIPTQNQPISVKSFTPIILKTGQVLVIGTKEIRTKELFENRHRKEVQTIEVYDPILNKFSTLKSTLNTSRKNPDLTLLNNGNVLISGGEELVRLSNKELTKYFISKSEIYDANTQTFQKVGNKKSRLLNSYGYGAKYLLPNGNILFIGGSEGIAESMKKVKSIEMYNVKSKRFKIVGNMRKARNNPIVIQINPNQIMIYGSDDTDKFNFERPSAEILDIRRFN